MRNASEIRQGKYLPRTEKNLGMNLYHGLLAQVYIFDKIYCLCQLYALKFRFRQQLGINETSLEDLETRLEKLLKVRPPSD